MSDVVDKVLKNCMPRQRNPVHDIMGKDKMMYSVVARKKVDIPDKDIKEVKKGKRKFLVGTYEYKGKKYTAWQTAKK